MQEQEDEELAAVPEPATGPLPVVAIVGRPNAGKSSFFNRLIRAPRAIVDPMPGVTRDRNVARAIWDDRAFLLVDTGGFDDTDTSDLAQSVRAQAALAAEEADIVLAMLDGQEGLNPADRDLMQVLRRLEKPVIYAINKIDDPKHEANIGDFFVLGLKEVFPISTAHGRGIDDLMERLLELLPPAGATMPVDVPYTAIRLAIIGRPNVGKSSLLNRLVGYTRSIVDSTPGTTRDPLDTPYRHGEQDYVLIDTAGIRRRPKVSEYVEKASAVRALRAIEQAEVAALVIDAVDGMAEQDARIAGYALERGRALLFVFNKWEAVPKERRQRDVVLEQLQYHYPSLAEVPVVFLSARTGAGVQTLLPAITRLVTAHRRRVRTNDLNRVLEQLVARRSAPSVRGRGVRFLYATQVHAAPPIITIFTSHPNDVPAAYLRYLNNEFRKAFEWYGTPLKINLRARRAEDPEPRPKPVARTAKGKPKRPRRIK